MKPNRFHVLLAATFVATGCAGVRVSSPPPTVTAKAWAVADGRTGRLLGGFNADEPRKSASTTKMMCAYVVLQLAEKNPTVLDETVTFSKLADSAPGSTTGITAGESVSVRDCLYGLLLPSGNDAGTALAEHFNSRCAPPDNAMRAAGLATKNLATRANFVAEMNRTARRFGLTRTVYRSPYGDGGTSADRTTTAHDLARLAWHAMRLPSFRSYVSTKQHECRVRQTEGTFRTVTWDNTCRLLGVDGCDGIKTGFTPSAGCCLVASKRREKSHLISVVLGCKTKDDRDADTRALFEWAWPQMIPRP
ncbi:MAG: D-alanyl-D-alanine carboxypeptidase [Verrucomicrobia bacterium]|nr:D-alanyl-D-alanine carboxypeptidase [Verrucomicrobiota bacterium]